MCRPVSFYTAQAAARQRLSVAVGRGLNYQNISPLAELGYIDEFVVGHALFARAMLVGLEKGIQELKRLIGVGGAREQ